MTCYFDIANYLQLQKDTLHPKRGFEAIKCLKLLKQNFQIKIGYDTLSEDDAIRL